jgi:redox-sensitive bicupin YhaK (pirin superfamily)
MLGNKSRPVARIVQSVQALEGEGFLVHRPFPTSHLADFDPFLLLDEMGPMELGSGEAKGAPDHPHRGFETVTYMLDGRFEHKDSHGNTGQLGRGDVQWMTAGAGVIHSEMPEAEFARRGGRLHGFQLWVNLPRSEKFIRPRYQEIPSTKIPKVTSADGSYQVRVIAGEALGAHALIDTRTPIMMLHCTLAAGAAAVQPVATNYNVFAYVFSGSGRFGDESRVAGEHQMVAFKNDGEEIRFVADERESLEFLLIGGVPLHEPVVRYGPFVMNTKEEIAQAITDYQQSRFGQIAAAH